MASFTQTLSGYLGGPDGRRLIMQRGTLVVAGEGADPADIPASVFGLAKILDVSVAVLADNSEVGLFAPSADGSGLVFTSLKQATDANRANVADATGSYVLTIIGE